MQNLAAGSGYMLIIIFWISVFFVSYTYFVYPLLLSLCGRIFNIKIENNNYSISGSLTAILIIRNEENNIQKKIDNLLSQQPSGVINSIIVVSDGSEDQTNNILSNIEIKHKNVIPIYIPFPKGKSHGITKALKHVQTEFVLFCDARQIFEEQAAYYLLKNFCKSNVGVVAGELKFINNSNNSDAVESVGLYWRYEKYLRKYEAICHMLTGCSGAIYAARTELIKDIPDNIILDDVWIPLSIALNGNIIEYEEKAIAWDIYSKNVTKEFERKVRTLLGNFQLIHKRPVLLSPLNNPVWFSFLSHKIFRLFVPYALIAAFVTNVMLIGKNYYYAILILQGFFYTSALLGYIFTKIQKKTILGKICSPSYMLVLLNIAAIVALVRYLTNNSNSVWK